jgi:hypothetical protein
MFNPRGTSAAQVLLSYFCGEHHVFVSWTGKMVMIKDKYSFTSSTPSLSRATLATYWCRDFDSLQLVIDSFPDQRLYKLFPFFRAIVFNLQIFYLFLGHLYILHIYCTMLGVTWSVLTTYCIRYFTEDTVRIGNSFITSLKSETAKIWSRVPTDSDPRKLRWQGPAASTNDRPVLSSERASHKKQDRNCQTVINIWSWAPVTFIHSQICLGRMGTIFKALSRYLLGKTKRKQCNWCSHWDSNNVTLAILVLSSSGLLSDNLD